MLIVGMGGSGREESATEASLALALDEARQQGAEVRFFPASELRFPLYDPTDPARSPEATRFIDAVAEADGIIVASPGYHGSVSGLVKNALDYVEDLTRHGRRPYLQDLPVGAIAVAHGWQAAVNTLRTLRDVVHALRAWPTPYGAAVNSAEVTFTDGRCDSEKVEQGLRLVARQVVQFARMADIATRNPGAHEPGT